MIKEQEILDELKKVKLMTELLANPLYNDAGGSHFWYNIDKKLKDIIDLLNKDKEIYKW